MKDKPPNPFRDALNTNLAELLALLQSVRSLQDEDYDDIDPFPPDEQPPDAQKRGNIPGIFLGDYELRMPLEGGAETHYLLWDDPGLLQRAIGIALFAKNCAQAKDNELISLADAIETTATKLIEKNRNWQRVAYHRRLAGLEWLDKEEVADALRFYNQHEPYGGFSTPRGYEINDLLAHLGYQVREGNNWRPTDKAEGLCEKPLQKYAVRWHRDLLSILRRAIEQGDVPASRKSLVRLGLKKPGASS